MWYSLRVASISNQLLSIALVCFVELHLIFWYIYKSLINFQTLNIFIFISEIRDAILRRHPGILDKAIANVQSSQYRSELMHYLENAKKLKEHLGELNRFSHDILQMEQETISEIRSYHHPPKGVKEVMLSTYLVLGYEESKLRVIKQI